MASGVVHAEGIDPSSPLPLHVQAERLVRRLVDEPAYRDGSALLPEEVTLANRWGISRGTLRQALGRLVDEGLLERRRGHGTRVRPQRLSSRLSAWGSFTAEMRSSGIDVQRLSTSVRRVRLSSETAGWLGAEAGAASLRVERVAGVADEPVVRFRSWLAPRLLEAGLGQDADWGRPLYELIESMTGVRVARSEERITAEPARGAVCRALGVEAGSALLVRQRVARDGGGRAVEYAVNHYRGDRFAYATELTREVRA
ncbi:MAG: GntR family transcriptional regulator [Planctomycetota bacterium]